MKYIIIGNGVAGDSAALALRDADGKAEIQIFTEESIPFYYRPRLIDVISGEIELNKIIIHNKDFYKKKNIELFLNTKVISLNIGNKTITTASGQDFNFDKLLIASGGYSFIPPIPGVEKTGVFSLRDAKDSKQILEYLKSVKNVIIIGGGLLGLETANSFVKQGKTVSVIEFFERLLPRQLDNGGALILRKELEEKGFNFYLNETTESISGEDTATGIKTKSGKDIPGELILISAGVRSHLELVKNTDIKTNRAIETDSFMQTSVPDIFAAGDCAEVKGVVYGIYPPAKDQGKVAGLNMSGKQTEYSGTISSHKLKVVGIDLFCIGKLDMENKLESKMIENPGKFIYKKAFIESEKIVGAMLLGDLNGAQEIEQAITRREPFSNVEEFFKE
ncbi:MAG: FAD-dependent oxidoreductase [bacterium]|nr:FAD-dependent oxidoreductase [bacterium]